MTDQQRMTRLERIRHLPPELQDMAWDLQFQLDQGLIDINPQHYGSSIGVANKIHLSDLQAEFMNRGKFRPSLGMCWVALEDVADDQYDKDAQQSKGKYGFIEPDILFPTNVRVIQAPTTGEYDDVRKTISRHVSNRPQPIRRTVRSDSAFGGGHFDPWPSAAAALLGYDASDPACYENTIGPTTYQARRITFNVFEKLNVRAHTVKFKLSRDTDLGFAYSGTYFVSFNDSLDHQNRTIQDEIAPASPDTPTALAEPLSYDYWYSLTGYDIENITFHVLEAIEGYTLFAGAH